MKHKTLLFGLLFFSIIIILSGQGQAACLPSAEDTFINSAGTYYLCGGTYILNDTNNNGVFIINSTDVILDLNNTNIIGVNFLNSSTSAINVSKKNTLIRNGAIQNFVYGINIAIGGSTNGNVTVQNVTITNITNNGISGNAGNLTFIGNTVGCFKNLTGIPLRSAIILSGSNIGAQVINNTIVGYCAYGIRTSFNYDHVNITGNVVRNQDVGVWLSDSQYVRITNNSFVNNSNDIDNYDIDIWVRDNLGNSHPMSDVLIANNSFTEVTSGAVLLTGAQNVTIADNNINFVAFVNRSLYAARDQGQTPCAVFAVEIFKNFEQSGASLAYNVGNISNTTVFNLAMTGNTFDSNTQCYLMAQGLRGSSINIPSSTYRRFTAIPTMLNSTEYWLPSSFNYLQRYNSALLEGGYIGNDSNAFQGNIILNYTLSNNNATFKTNTAQSFIWLNGSGANDDLRNVSTNNYLFANINGATMNVTSGSTYQVLDGGCDTIPVDGLSITGTKTLCGGDYNIADTGGNGVISFGISSSSTLNCNGTRLIGDFTASSRGIDLNTRSNLIISGCYLQGYTRGIQVSTGQNHTLINNFFNKSGRGIYSDSSAQRLIAINNRFFNSSIYLSANSPNSTLENNSFFCEIDGCYDRVEAIYLGGTDGAIVKGNTINNSQVGIWINTQALGNNITNNYLLNNDRGLIMSAVIGTSDERTRIINNTFYNNSNNYDFYNLDISIINATNVDIEDNTILQSPDVSILMQGVLNSNIKRNSFDIVCMNNRTEFGFSSNTHSQNEPCTAIMLKQFYKTWCYTTNCEAEITTAISENITITGNTFDTDTEVFMYLQGSVNVTHDLSSYYYRKFLFPRFSNISELYVNNYYTGYLHTTGPNNMYEGRLLNTSTYRPYNVSSTQLWFGRVGSIAFNVTLLSANAYFPYNDVKNVSTNSVLNYNIDNQSYTLMSGQQISVGDQVQIASVSSSVANTNVDVSWTTLRPMNSSVLYLGSLNDNVTSHVIHLSGLTAATTYYFNISVCDYLGGAGCKTYDGGYSFTTGTPPSVSTNDACSTARSGIVSAFVEFPSWFITMFVVLVMAILVGLGFFMMNKFDLDVNLDSLLVALAPVLVAGIILVIGIVILSSMC